jgi:hypothetical protein
MLVEGISSDDDLQTLTNRVTSRRIKSSIADFMAFLITNFIQIAIYYKSSTPYPRSRYI